MEETIGLADERLSAAFRENGCFLSALPGMIDGVAVHDRRGRYLFAWHTHPRHLLFYLRKPALEAKSTLRQKAMTRQPEGQVSQNPGGETLVTIKENKEAETLLSWLLPALPLR